MSEKKKPLIKDEQSSKYNKYGFQNIQIKKMSSEETINLFIKAGIIVTEDEAEEIMELLYTITQITLKEFLSPD
ncbi:hypothetical protein [Pedobacter agri]|uniref:hypothetical protein n=1 Tax=Pedobacter agri TaxID=454586 RepID=UPI00292EBB78|nr:hypothetical protein [Pedobacter agri]